MNTSILGKDFSSEERKISYDYIENFISLIPQHLSKKII